MKNLVIMGVSGSGKSTIGKLFAQETGGVFLDGDDFHPPENVAKMSTGVPLTDADRQGWLEKLATFVQQTDRFNIIACSALKESYRAILKEADFVFLHGSEELLAERLANRKGHYMPPDLLKSQLATLEIPPGIFTVDIEKSPEELVSIIRKHFQI